MATKALLKAAQAIMDLYYQNFSAEDQFFDKKDFAAWIGRVYDKAADDAAKEIYATSRVELGIGQLVFSPDWIVRTQITVDKQTMSAPLDFKFASFTYDTQTSGIQDIRAKGVQLIRTTLTESWVLNGIAKSNTIYWYVDMDKINFVSKGNCNIEKVDVYYIPSSEDDQFKLPKSKEFDIATTAWNLMLMGKKETPFIDKSNNQNQNIAPQTETDLKNTQPVK